MEVEEWVLTGFSRQGEQVCSEGRPRRLARKLRNDLVRQAVERVDDLGSDELLSRHFERVGVALDRIMKPGGWVAEFSQQCAG